MKYAIILLITLGMGLCIYKATMVPAPPRVTKKVIAKFDPVEPVSDTNTHQSATHYYLVASDGARVRVGMGTYATTQAGDSITSSGWE